MSLNFFKFTEKTVEIEKMMASTINVEKTAKNIIKISFH